ncbi:unnamed protein product, partial [Amoebophrya sp. A25]
PDEQQDANELLDDALEKQLVLVVEKSHQQGEVEVLPSKSIVEESSSACSIKIKNQEEVTTNNDSSDEDEKP